VTEIRLRPRAEEDLVERTRYCLEHAGDRVADQFFRIAMETLQAVERMPGAGSPRIGELCDIPGLRARRIEGFPCSWLYFVGPHVDVVRLLAHAQDLPSLLADDQDP
jgi:toxin ParE1/3/4